MENPCLRIEKVVPGGSGLGRLPDGRAVFVPFTLPGETVTVRLTSERKSLAFAEVLDIREPSVRRRTPPCPHFRTCGGCQLQHAEHGLQLELKRAMVEEVWRGRVEVEAGEASPEEFGYRHRVRLHVAPDNRAVGFMRPRSHDVAPIRDCLLCRPAIREVIRWLSGTLLPRLSPRRWPLSEILLAMGETPPVHLVPQFRQRPAGPFPRHLLESAPVPVALASASTPPITFRISDFRFEATAEAFFQANVAALESLFGVLRGWCPEQSEVLELFCGMGLFTAIWGSRGCRVTAVEGNDRLEAPFARTARLNEAGQHSFVLSSVEDWLARNPDLSAFGALFLDPPRCGLSDEARTALAGKLPAHSAYLSCDPLTQYRDLRAAAPDAVPRLRLFDFFPNTAHVECLAML